MVHRSFINYYGEALKSEQKGMASWASKSLAARNVRPVSKANQEALTLKGEIIMLP